MTDVAVVGPGAIGATFAAAAERAGHAVALCGRRAGPAPVVELPDGAEHALAGQYAATSARPGMLPGCCSRSRRTRPPHVRLARALMRSRHGIAVLQNGVEHEALVAPLAGPATVLPAIVWCPAETVAPGRVRQRERAQLSVPASRRAPPWPRCSATPRVSIASPTFAPRRGASSASTPPWRRWC